MTSPPRSESGPRVVVIGAGIVGCALADELTARGWCDVTVLERGTLFAGNGSSYHAPGLVFRTSPCRTLTELASYTVAKYRELPAPADSVASAAGATCFDAVGGLEVATSEERWADLSRKAGLAASWGVTAELLDPRRCAELWPLLDPDRVYGGLYTPDDGLADASLACRAQAERAIARGATFHGGHTVTGVRRDRHGVTGVATDRGDFAADVVVCAAGFWGPVIGRLAGVRVPLTPLAHQYARSHPLPAEATATAAGGRPPILRHQDRDLYFRLHGDRLGVGSYAHRPMPIDPFTVERSELPFHEADFAPSWADARELMPRLTGTTLAEGFDGVFSFTPDGMPLLGESRELPGFWLAEAVWVTHSAGVARAVAEWLVDGRPSTDVHRCDVHRFEEAQLSPRYVADRGEQSFVEVYDIIHPLQPIERPRPLRTSPFHPRQRELGAHQLEAAGWERPQWFEANAPLAEELLAREPDAVPRPDAWAARHWSPIVAAEARATRERVALYDMTPLKRLEVSGPGALAFLQRVTSNQLDRRPGSVTYTLLLDHAGGVRSDVTAARLAEDRWQLGCNGNLDLDWLLRRRAEAERDGAQRAAGPVTIRDLTPGTCCVGVWGPLARELVQPLADRDFSHRAFRFYTAKRAHVGHVPVTAMRLSYVGELGWELYTSADLGLRLWDTLWREGQRLGVVAAGRGAFNSLRLEKGYRAWGQDMTAEHDPYEAGLGFAVRPDKGDFLGRDALAGRSAETATRRLTCLTLDDPTAVVLGGEPVYFGGAPAGYVTSAGYGYTIGQGIAYAWLPAAATVPGTGVQLEYFGTKVPATVRDEPLYDPAMERLRR